MRVLAYLRVSTQDQADSGLGLAAQRAALASEFSRRGWPDVEWITEAKSARTLKRPGLERALALLAAGDADVLAVSKMDRCSRSLLDFAGLLATAQREGWALLALDSPADVTTPHGEAMAGVQAVFAQLERRLISERTKAALAAKRAQGVKLGRSPVIPEATAALARELRASGLSLRSVGAALADAGHLPPSGRWSAEGVRKLLARPVAA